MPRFMLRTALAALAATAVTAMAGPITDDAAAAPVGPAPIVGGSDVPNNAYPYAAGIREGVASRFFCTGTLIAPRWVLTAAHCVDGERANASINVKLGQADQDVASASAETINVDRKIVNPGWGGDAGDKGDVAVLHLERDAVTAPARMGRPQGLTDGIQKCDRYPYNTFPYSAANACVAAVGTVLGWGRTSSSDPSTSRKLQKVRGPIFSRQKNGQFWVAKVGACPGDSGGPLLAEAGGRDHRLYLIGVASHVDTTFAGGYCSTDGRDYYSDVAAGSKLYKWVQAQLAAG